jgi:RNA polymerase sigma factor (sigma-70 family)
MTPNAPLEKVPGLKPPSQRQTRQWIRLAQGGDVEARNALLRTNLPLVIYLVKQYYRPGSFMEMQDLIQHGCLGLLKAIDGFDLKMKRNGKQVRFNTYVGLRVMEAVLREIDNHGRTIAVPVNVQAYLRSIARSEHLGSKQNRKAVSLESTATAFSMSVQAARSLNLAALDVVPLEITLENDESVERSLPSLEAQSRDLQRLFAQQDHRDHISRLLSVIPERERFVIEQHYGLIPGNSPKTLMQIASILRICEERVRQIEIRAIKRMRQMSAPSSKAPETRDSGPISKKWGITNRCLVFGVGASA